jgi:uncharacterized protein (DUF427 family)
MTLTRFPGPLAGGDDQRTNYRLDGPAHQLLMHPFPRRVRAEVFGQTVLDTRDGVLLHETGLLPQLYVPEADVRADLLEPSELHTYCPFKGHASYYSVRVGDRVERDAVWYYPNPIDTAPWLKGYLAMYWTRMDRWLDEDDEVVGHLPDPFHRVDIRATSQRIRVSAGDTVLAESTSALVLSETGLPNRYYLPAADIRAELVRSDTRTSCPYKGRSTYWTLRLPDREIADVAWSYEEPLPESARIAGHRSFDHEDVTVDFVDP